MRLGEGHSLAGRLEDALLSAQRALALTRTHGERGYQAYALRLLGDIHAQHEPPDDALAETHYRDARPGRQAGHAPAPGALPPRPRHTVCPGRKARAGPHRHCPPPSRCTRTWGRHLLASRGGTGAAGSAMTRKGKGMRPDSLQRFRERVAREVHLGMLNYCPDRGQDPFD